MAKLTYRDAGVDTDLYDQALAGIAPLLKKTQSPRVLDGFGGFASLFALGRDYADPVLVTCTDGVGTKLKVAGLTNRHDTVGIDLVAMSVNDCLCTGATPLVFLDYLALPKDDPERIRQLVQGIAAGCLEAGCALVGGETAILPDFYKPGDYDMAGFCLGAVERADIIDGSSVGEGDLILGLASTGLHSNGYSLARKIAFDHAGLTVDDRIEELGQTVGEALLTPTRIYVKPVLDVLKRFPGRDKVVPALAHITGEGLPGNLPRVLPPGCRARLRAGSWDVPPVFGWLQRLGNVDAAEMRHVFNLGVGFTMVVRHAMSDTIRSMLIDSGVPTTVIGDIIVGEPGVEWVE